MVEIRRYTLLATIKNLIVPVHKWWLSTCKQIVKPRTWASAYTDSSFIAQQLSLQISTEFLLSTIRHCLIDEQLWRTENTGRIRHESWPQIICEKENPENTTQFFFPFLWWANSFLFVVVVVLLFWDKVLLCRSRLALNLLRILNWPPTCSNPSASAARFFR